MITAERKPFEEIKEMVKPYSKLLVVGCGTCVAECAAGGEKEVALLASALRMEARMENRVVEIDEMTLDRQCVYEFIDQLTETVDNYDAILSLGCGAGVQAVSDVFPDMTVLPALNTTFLGETKAPGVWMENCRGCGDCKLHIFGAICPVARCAKGLFNGPCGGSKDKRCEVHPDTPCAWHMIIERLEKKGRLEQLNNIYPPVDWSTGQGKGPRKIEREDQMI
ncbi:MAG: methylenetetrahydrofolate reductase C-terminal domain-containing protein [Syntrophorhabdaceae bacterium]|nr:methylenetetrahydrofolate reductase C-terminal domain-containing protein [Syntrophorhabdaceae bacterium]